MSDIVEAAEDKQTIPRSRQIAGGAGVLLIVVLVAMTVRMTGGPSLPSGRTDPAAEAMLQIASGACAARITALEEFDERPSDGNQYTRASLEVIASSGEVPDSLHLVMKYGGMRPFGDDPVPPTRLRHDSLKVGERHWFVFGTAGDGTEFPYGVTGWWPWEDPNLPSAVVEAVRTDRFADHPVYDVKSGLVHEWAYDADEDSTTLRVRDADQRVWERSLSGAPELSPLYVHHSNPWYELEWPADREFLGLEVRLKRELPPSNFASVPGGFYRVRHMLGLRKGQTLASWVAENTDGWNLIAFRQYDADSGVLVLSLDFSELPTGGLDAGAGRDDWRRKEERRFDPETGRMVSLRHYQYGSIPAADGSHLGNGWIPVDDDAEPAKF